MYSAPHLTTAGLDLGRTSSAEKHVHENTSTRNPREALVEKNFAKASNGCLSQRKPSTKMAAKHLAKPVRDRPGQAPTSISGVYEIVRK